MNSLSRFRVVAGCLFVGLAAALYGQATVVFNNRVPGVIVSRVYDPGLLYAGNGTNDVSPGLVDWTPFSPVSGAAYSAQLLAAPGADQPENALMPALPVTTFRTGAAAGFVVGTTATLQNMPPDAPVATVQMAVWDNLGGTITSWFQALLMTRTGTSPKFNVYNLGGASNSPPYLTNLVSFSICFLEGSGQPWIFLQPQPLSVQAGDPATFELGASASTPDGRPYDYQWRFQGADLPGATDSRLVITNAQLFHSGLYQAELRARPDWIYSAWAGQSSTSSPAMLTVLPHPTRPRLLTGPGYGGFDGREFQFTLLGPKDMVYRIEATSNLIDWQEVVWVTNSSGSALISIPHDATAHRRFYRAAR